MLPCDLNCTSNPNMKPFTETESILQQNHLSTTLVYVGYIFHILNLAPLQNVLDLEIIIIQHYQLSYFEITCRGDRGW